MAGDLRFLKSRDQGGYGERVSSFVVSFEECVEMYHVLYDAGVDVTAWEIEGAEHEGNFWSVELWKVIIEFIQKNL